MVRSYYNKYYYKLTIRYYIEDFLGARFHFFEDGFKLNLEFMKWKLKNYFGLSYFKLTSFMDILYFLIYLTAIPFIIISILLTPFLTELGISQRDCLIKFKRRNFGIHDPTDLDDYYYIMDKIRKRYGYKKK